MRKTTLSIILIVLGPVMGKTLSAQTYLHIIEDATGADFVQQSVAKVNQGEYIVVGTVAPGPVSGNSDILAMMIDNSGSVAWAKYIDYGQDEFAGSLVVDQNGDYVLTGYTGTNGGDWANKDLIMVKLDHGGSIVDDVVIGDVEPGYGFSLYGMDIEQTDGGDYIVAGTGAFGAVASADKYGFVLRVSQNLSAVQWGYRYESQFGATLPIYDSFNDLLKVENHPYGEAYLLTGSGMALSNNHHMISNDLIDPNGNSLWGGAIGHWQQNSLSLGGVSGLYREASNEFFVLYHKEENIVSFSVLDGSTGGSLGLANLHNHTIQDFYWNPHDIAWGDSNQNGIVLAGHYLEYTNPSGPARPMFMTWDIVSSSIEWTRYAQTFSGNDYMNINFDYIVQPLNYTNLPSAQINQLYYKPKSLARLNDGFVFAAPFQQQGSSFGMSFFKTDPDGKLDGMCMFDVINTREVTGSSLNDEPNFVRQPHDFKILDRKVYLVAANVNDQMICYSPQPVPKPQMGVNPKRNSEIMVYPNPSDDYLMISGLSGLVAPSIALYDASGRKVFQINPKGDDEERLFVPQLQNGIYFLRVVSKGKVVFLEKVVKE